MSSVVQEHYVLLAAGCELHAHAAEPDVEAEIHALLSLVPEECVSKC